MANEPAQTEGSRPIMYKVEANYQVQNAKGDISVPGDFGPFRNFEAAEQCLIALAGRPDVTFAMIRVDHTIGSTVVAQTLPG